MPLSLKDVIQQPTHTKAVIKLALHSPEGAKRVWCVVEAPDDVTIYRKFFDTTIVSILPSDDEERRRSCRNVEKIVSELYREEENLFLLGIRDCDYTRYDISYSPPANVFVTDCRDIEMMMFSAPSVIEELKAWDVTFPEKIEECACVERYLGYFRIYNELQQTSCSFHDGMTKVSLIWDFATHSIKPDYKKNLFNRFKELCEEDVTEEEFDSFVEEKRLEEEPYVNVCRGHDMFNLLPTMMIRQEYSRAKGIWICMVNAYSYDDFSITQLYTDIKEWANVRNLMVFCRSVE